MAPGDLKLYNKATKYWSCKKAFLKLSQEILKKFEKAKYRLLEVNKWEACMGNGYSEKKKIQKELLEALSSLNHKVKDHNYISNDSLDPSYYVSVPEIFNDLLYKSNGVELKLMTDINEYLIVENEICEEITIAKVINTPKRLHRHKYIYKVNNLHCSNYNSSKPKSYIMDKDINILYSSTMIQFIPIKILDKVSPEKVPDIQSIAPDAKLDYALE
ncbi:36210_t:CDS:2, partial [Gigaspora margarita]